MCSNRAWLTYWKNRRRPAPKISAQIAHKICSAILRNFRKTLSFPPLWPNIYDKQCLQAKAPAAWFNEIFRLMAQGCQNLCKPLCKFDFLSQTYIGKKLLFMCPFSGIWTKDATRQDLNAHSSAWCSLLACVMIFLQKNFDALETSVKVLWPHTDLRQNCAPTKFPDCASAPSAGPFAFSICLLGRPSPGFFVGLGGSCNRREWCRSQCNRQNPKSWNRTHRKGRGRRCTGEL